MTARSWAEEAGCSVEPRKKTEGNSGSLLINCLVPIMRSLSCFDLSVSCLHSTIEPRSAGLVQAS